MTLIDRSSGSEPAVRSTHPPKKKPDGYLQALAERILQLLKNEARLERERQGPR